MPRKILGIVDSDSFVKWGASLLATFPLAVAATNTLTLEPYFTLFALAGACLLFIREAPRDLRIVLAGICFALAIDIKLWALIPVVIAVGAVLGGAIILAGVIYFAVCGRLTQ